jgi:hypothetical protein
MIRKGFLVAGLALAATILARAADPPGQTAGAKPPYVHAVIFYLKKDAPKGEVEALIEDTHKLLAKIPTVRNLWVGRPAERATPDYAIKDFQVGLLVLFDDYNGLKAYLDHKLHQEYLDKHGKYWDKVPVYDFVNQNK